MDNLGKLLAFLKELGMKPNVDSFQDRLVIQKTACLIELSGMKLGYPFSLYVRGPYSPLLTKDLYGNKRAVSVLASSYVPSEKEKRQLHLLSQLTNGLDPTLLEIIATYSFLAFRLGNDERQALVKLKKLKSFYSEGKIALGVSRAKQLLFKPTERELQELKQELRPWQDVSAMDMRY